MADSILPWDSNHSTVDRMSGGVDFGFMVTEKLGVSLPNYIETAIEVGKVINHAVIAVLTGNIAFLVEDIVSFASAARHCKAECKRLGEQMKIARDSAKDLLDKLGNSPKEIEDKNFITALKAFAIVLEDGRAVVKQHAEAKYGLKIFHAKKFAAEFVDIEDRLDQACDRLNLALNIRRYVDSQDWEETHRTWHQEDRIAFERLNAMVKESLEEIRNNKQPTNETTMQTFNDTKIVTTSFTNWEQFKTDRLFTATYNAVDEHKKIRSLKVVVKVTRAREADPKEMKLFALEVSYLKKLAPCPNIIKLIGITPRRGVMALVLEYCEKGDLQALIAAGDLRGDWGKKRAISLGIAQGVAYLHEAGIFHKYINSGNILVNSHFQPKITNFRKSRWTTQNSLGFIDSFEEQIRWTAIERLGDEVAIFTAACDVYSFGIVYYEIITEKFPWQGLQLDAVYNLRKVEGKELTFDQNIPPAISNILTNCTHKNPLQRFTTKEIIDHLEAIRPEELETSNFLSPASIPSLNLDDLMSDDEEKSKSLKDQTIKLSLSDVSDEEGPTLEEILNNGESYHQALQFTKARKEFEKAEEAPRACFRLGEYYFYGKGVDQDSVKATKYFEKAAEGDDGDAMDMLGFIFLTGKGGTKDRNKAVKLFQNAAAKEIPFGIYHLGVCYFKGICVNKDKEEAKRLIFKAARLGNDEAQRFAHSQKWDVQS